MSFRKLKTFSGGNAECLCDEFYKYHNQTCEFDNKVNSNFKFRIRYPRTESLDLVAFRALFLTI